LSMMSILFARQLQIHGQNSMDDSDAREEWGWNPEYDLEAMTKDMLEVLSKKLK